jgi:hypothetical protein
MAKRFTDTDKYKSLFFRGLQGAYKLLWDYIIHDCNHAGIWIVDFEIAQLYLGNDVPVTKEVALKSFNKDKKRIYELCGGRRWFIKSFVDFQYGELNEGNRVHKSVLDELKKSGLDKPLINSLKGVKDKDKDKDIDFIGQIVQKFVEVHGGYTVVSMGKEREMAGKLLNTYKKVHPDHDSEQTLEGLAKFFSACVNIQDAWLRDHMSLSTMVNKYNEIKTALKNGKTGKNGATVEALSQLIADKFGTDAVVH